ncbi:hypothetical protein HMPREF1981_02351 [Bacteroides pyogenes F0041]|uniref:Uncharacterized protein n=1 Tax=Bacteroides pyogenes F0041 TaxID=1321819 RepID=U2C228_9BACE|nr:hypothetical protein HMPREF1981_02351 [Bacteroides pyogenes F0041]
MLSLLAVLKEKLLHYQNEIAVSSKQNLWFIEKELLIYQKRASISRKGNPSAIKRKRLQDAQLISCTQGGALPHQNETSDSSPQIPVPLAGNGDLTLPGRLFSALSASATASGRYCFYLKHTYS